jgi:hydrogenase maturation protease
VKRVVIAGVGNIFAGDDGFGVAVARRLANAALPAGVEVVDIGIRTYDLAFRLLDPYDWMLVIDAVRRGGAPGTLYLIAPDPATPAPCDGHGLSLSTALSFARQLGATVEHVLVLGCEPAVLEPGLGLSRSVAQAIDPAISRILELIAEGGHEHGMQSQT